MILDVDIGNTRIKWRQGDQRFAALRSDDWQSQLLAIPSAPERIRVANVGGADVAKQLIDNALAQWGVQPEFAVVSERAAGVQCCYTTPSRLGIDRWLALLAAYGACQGPAVVVDAGSAITVDAVGQQGLQLGGFIVPGLDMQRRALFADTSQVQVKEGWAGAELALGQDTLSAVHNGCLSMAVALVEQVLARQLPGAKLFVTGGDAELLVQHLSIAASLQPDLVLDGLAVLMP